MKRIAQASIDSTDRNYVHRIDTAGFSLVADEPVHAGGQGEGPAPYDYYLASLAACSAITLRMYAQRKGWDLGRLRIDLSLEMDHDRNVRVHRVIHADGVLDDGQWDRLLEIVANTPVTRTMREGAEITSERGD